MVDPEMSLVGQAPPCRKPDRRDQARFEALNRAGSGWEIVRETLNLAVVYRIRLIEPISADFAVLVGDAIRNLRSSLDQLPISWPCSTLVPSPRMQSD